MKTSRLEVTMLLLRILSILFAMVVISHTELVKATDLGKEWDTMLVQGRSGKALSCYPLTQKRVEVAGRPEYFQWPLTIECWVKWKSGGLHNPIVTAGAREAIHHWELFVPRWNSGDVGVYLGGYGPLTVLSPQTLVSDDSPGSGWHYLAVVIDGETIRFFVDAQETKVVKLPDPGTAPSFDPSKAEEYVLQIGSNGTWNSEMPIDEIRFSNVARAIKEIPEGPFEVDNNTIGLWRFDKVGESGLIADESALDNPAQFITPVRVSLNEIDRRSFDAGPSPLDTPATEVSLSPGRGDLSAQRPALLLDGTWQMVTGGSETERLSGDWNEAIPAQVPGSIHTALFKAGKIPDPNLGKNMVEIARELSYRDYWFRKSFPRPEGQSRKMLVVEGVCDEHTAWLNGQLLGHHIGKYIPVEYDVTNLLADDNDLVIKVHAIRREVRDVGNWLEDVCSWGTDSDICIPATTGWHYARLGPQGIWQSVQIEDRGPCEILNPFVVTEDAHQGLVHLVTQVRRDGEKVSGKLQLVVCPENFTGPAFHLEHKIESGTDDIHLRFQIPEARIWWPVDLGEPNLYRLELAFTPESGGPTTQRNTVFGVRTIETQPLPGGPYANLYNWQFVVNGKPVFLKGANWCFVDLYLDLPQEKYDRFIGLARDQHVQVLRAWGAGTYETNEFYQACDRHGVMVYQEFPGGPMEITRQTLESFINRMRNHPSLIWYGGGNEIDIPFTPLYQMMGRLTIELDGTRPFHRTDPWGGSQHDYGVFWGNAPFEHNVELARKYPFIGEFGFTAMPNYESVQRYLPEDEKDLWPAPKGSSFRWHTPAFDRDAGYGQDVSHLTHYVKKFSDPNISMERYIVTSQIAQSTALRLPLETMRTRWPETGGICYYKLTNPVPAGSYATIDYYGAPKLSHYFVMDAYQPLHACAIWNNLNPMGQPVSLPIWLLDDSDTLQDAEWTVNARVYDASLELVETFSFSGAGSIDRVRKVGEVSLESNQTADTPLLVVTEVTMGDSLAARTFYWANYEAEPGCLFNLPPTTLKLSSPRPHCARVLNTGNKQAVGVHWLTPGAESSFRAADSFFWLEPGESHEVEVSTVEGITVSAWNSMKD